MKQTGDEYFDSNEFRDLLADYEKAVNAGQPVFMDADELAEIADYYQMTGSQEQAEDAIKLALSLSPNAVAPLTYRVHEALYNGDTLAARDYLGQMLAKDDPDYVYCTAEILLAEGKTEEADKYLREQFKLVPPDEYQDYVVDVANIFSDYGASEKAMAWMARARHEDSPDFKELMARTLFGLGKYKDSEKLFNELIDTDPFQKRYWNALASAQYMNEDYSGSVQSSEYAIAIDPTDAEGLLAKANGLYRLNNYEEAGKYYARYLEQEPDDEFARMNQGSCQINYGDFEAAVDTLHEALRRAPADSPYLADIYQELAFAYSEQNEPDRALDALNQTDQLECDHVQMLIVKGHILLSAARVDEAEECFREAVLRSDDAPRAMLRIIVSLYDNHYLKAAYQMFQKFFQVVAADNTEGYAYMALCCHDLKRYDEFLEYLKKACQLNQAECKLALGHLFPENMEPAKYYDYIKERMK